jgi:hypothetical protein
MWGWQKPFPESNSRFMLVGGGIGVRVMCNSCTEKAGVHQVDFYGKLLNVYDVGLVFRSVDAFYGSGS